MSTVNKKGTICINYGTSNDNLTLGSFDEVPMNTFVAIIDLKMPYIKANGELDYKEYEHRIFCGDDIPANIFLEAYHKTLSKERLFETKKRISEGENKIVVPLNESNPEFAFLSDKDSLCRTRPEFEDAIYNFKDQFSDVLDFVVPEEEYHKNRM